MTPETKICQNCKTKFLIEPEDFDFYKKIAVPPPTWCPECRNIRRFAWREDRTLYKNTCALCKKSTISIHAPEGPFTVYCRECWFSDKWNPLDYGQDYDPHKSFFAQYRELMEKVPRPALTGTNLVNSEYSHACHNVKNCYSAFWAWFTEDSQYVWTPLLSKYTFDSYVTDKSDHTYETLLSDQLYRVRFAYFSHNCLDSSFLYDCVGCSDCFGSVNLRKKKYCLFNEQLSKEDYASRIKYWDLGSYDRLEEAKKKFRELYLSVPHRYADIIGSTNTTGDVVRDSKDCIMCFSCLEDVTNCKYIYFAGLGLKDSYDGSAIGDSSELLYEASYTTRAQRVRFASGSSDSMDIEYCDWANFCSHMFGCIATRSKKYCVLNKQYSPDEYKALTTRIREDMNSMPYIDSRGREYRYGEFFPPEISAFSYNESLAFAWYPKTKPEALAEGFQWRDPSKSVYQITVEPGGLPDHIDDTEDSIVDEIIGCLHGGSCNHMCPTAFRITKEELAFYRDMRIAIPRLCPNCRHAERITWRNGFHLWHRQCMCEKDGHNHPGRCLAEFETTFAPEKPEIVYCDTCYKKEFL